MIYIICQQIQLFTVYLVSISIHQKRCMMFDPLLREREREREREYIYATVIIRVLHRPSGRRDKNVHI